MQDLFTGVRGRDVLRSSLSPVYLSGSLLVGANLRDATLDNAVFQWADLYQANIATAELQRLASTGVLIGAMMPDGSRPYPVPPQAEAEFRKHPESELAQREREVGRLELACWSSRLVYAEELS
jgi:hypothetical protein